jgi:hypothetical protein
MKAAETYQILVTRYNHPDIKSGQHTNGKPNLFVREDDGSHWHFVDGIHSAYKVRCLIEDLGWQDFTKRHCVAVEN